jgi:hypothetical protein
VSVATASDIFAACTELDRDCRFSNQIASSGTDDVDT